MRAVFGLVLVVGMALAGAAVYMIQGYIAQTEALLQRERDFNATAGKLVEVYVFNRQLAYGDPLTPEDVQLIYWPEQALPEAIFRDPAELFPENAPGPRYVMRATEAFEPVLASRVTEPGELARPDRQTGDRACAPSRSGSVSPRALRALSSRTTSSTSTGPGGISGVERRRDAAYRKLDADHRGRQRLQRAARWPAALMPER